MTGVEAGMSEPDDDFVALIDMDGTVADYDLAMYEGLSFLASPQEITDHGPVETWLRGSFPQDILKRRMDFIKKRPGFFENLKPIETGMSVVALLQDLGYRLMIASKAPGWGDEPWVEKARWCRKHLPEPGITLTHDKSLLYGKVLFDDWPAYTEAWLKHRPRGKVIMLDGPHNQGYEHPNCLRIYRTSVSGDPKGKAGSVQLKTIEQFLATSLGPDKSQGIQNQFFETFLVHSPEERRMGPGAAGGCLCRCCGRRGVGTGYILHTMDCAAAELMKSWGSNPLQHERPYGGVPK